MAYTGLALVCMECSFYSLYRHYSLAFGLQDGLLGAVSLHMKICIYVYEIVVYWCCMEENMCMVMFTAGNVLNGSSLCTMVARCLSLDLV